MFFVFQNSSLRRSFFTYSQFLGTISCFLYTLKRLLFFRSFVQNVFDSYSQFTYYYLVTFFSCLFLSNAGYQLFQDSHHLKKHHFQLLLFSHYLIEDHLKLMIFSHLNRRNIFVNLFVIRLNESNGWRCHAISTWCLVTTRPGYIFSSTRLPQPNLAGL